MNVRVRKRENNLQKEKEKTIEKGNYFSIPYEIQEIIDKRGFFVYKWFNFYEIYDSHCGFSLLITLFLLICSIFLENYDEIVINFLFLLSIIVCSVFFVLYLLKILKTNYIIITNKYILLNRKAIDLRRKDLINDYIQLLRKKLKDDSYADLSSKKGRILAYVSFISTEGFFNKIIMTILFLMGYIISFPFFLLIYFISFSIFWSNNEDLFLINKLFEKIDKNSEKLLKTKKEVMLNLLKAKNSDWKDGLLLDINKGLSKIGKMSKTCVKESEKLRKVIQKSKYNYMYDFDIYNKRIKKQIYDPIKEIEEILENNKKSLYKSKGEVLVKVVEREGKEHEEAMKSQNIRLNMNIEQIEKNLQLIRSYREKLEVNLNG